MSFISFYEFVCLVETFEDSFTSTLFPSFTSFVTPAKKLSHHGRSGGVIVLVRRSIVQELCESRGGRPELSVLKSLLVFVDVKIY